jgi:predicted Zn-dependent protease
VNVLECEKRKKMFLVMAAFCLLFFAANSPAQDNHSQVVFVQAEHAFSQGRYDEAEKQFRQLIKNNPSNIFAQVYLGHSLFRQQKYSEAIEPYEKARELERNGQALGGEGHRILVDQLVMAYGISGNLKKAHDLLDEAIQQDPEYPLNYYNRACAFAEEGDKDKMLANLALAFEHKDHVLKGEQIPDPRSDSSFQKYLSDPDFVSLMKKLGYK